MTKKETGMPKEKRRIGLQVQNFKDRINCQRIWESCWGGEINPVTSENMEQTELKLNKLQQ